MGDECRLGAKRRWWTVSRRRRGCTTPPTPENAPCRRLSPPLVDHSRTRDVRSAGCALHGSSAFTSSCVPRDGVSSTDDGRHSPLMNSCRTAQSADVSSRTSTVGGVPNATLHSTSVSTSSYVPALAPGGVDQTPPPSISYSTARTADVIDVSYAGTGYALSVYARNDVATANDEAHHGKAPSTNDVHPGGQSPLQPSDKTAVAAQPFNDDPLIVCRDVERTFGYRVGCQQKTANDDAAADRVSSLPSDAPSSLPQHQEDSFRLQPLADRVPFADGSYETEDSRRHRLENNIAQPTLQRCDCVDGEDNEKHDGPYYTHLGAGPSVAAVRRIMESRLELKGDAIRMEKVVYTGKEGCTEKGCPLAKWIIQRSGPHEKALVLVRVRAKHHCATAVLVVLTVLWEGVPSADADLLYDYLSSTLPRAGLATSRHCALNTARTCTCQQGGRVTEKAEEETGGACYSFGCAWSLYYDRCKFARSARPNLFRMKEAQEVGIATCALNTARTCTCQQGGRVTEKAEEETGGACYSFGCAWSLYYDRCKFARSARPNLFRMKEAQEVGIATCALNTARTCTCQQGGRVTEKAEEETGGACYSFGCAWSLYYDRCKFARSARPNLFRMKEAQEVGIATCALNTARTCTCQQGGRVTEKAEEETGGACYSFGCAWSLYYDRCKFARSARPNLFRMKEAQEVGIATCALNTARTCTCQQGGRVTEKAEEETGGACYSFGCAWSLYYDRCKFARSARPNLFRMKEAQEVGIATCALNTARTCTCQQGGRVTEKAEEETGGACYSFGCAWSLYYDRCKFARSARPNLFRMKEAQEVGIATCALNTARTCTCQQGGRVTEKAEEETGGACYSFGCAWSLYYDRCKFARSARPNLFRMKEAQEVGIATCALNTARTCTCQQGGRVTEKAEEETGGACYSFGGAWSLYYDRCKFARSTRPNLIRMKEPQEVGIATSRHCALNTARTCTCQRGGRVSEKAEEETGGACYSFGCAWSLYYDLCNFARSTRPNLFRMKEPLEVGFATSRHCALNTARTCTCQRGGRVSEKAEEETGGACYSFGCAWSLYYDLCNFARSTRPNLFRMKEPLEVGFATSRHCALNTARTCTCQQGGRVTEKAEEETGGECYSFGYDWSLYYDRCKFVRSARPNLFRMKEAQEEEHISTHLHRLADQVYARYERVAPAACRNQTYLSYRAPECRLGGRPGGPFTGVTACVDFCAHAHRDTHNMANGCTVVVSLTGRRRRVVKAGGDDMRRLDGPSVKRKVDDSGTVKVDGRRMIGGVDVPRLQVTTSISSVNGCATTPLKNKLGFDDVDRRTRGGNQCSGAHQSQQHVDDCSTMSNNYQTSTADRHSFEVGESHRWPTTITTGDLPDSRTRMMTTANSQPYNSLSDSWIRMTSLGLDGNGRHSTMGDHDYCTMGALPSTHDHYDEDDNDDQQLHVLPLYVPADTDEHGDADAQKRKSETGEIVTLHSYPMVLRHHRTPLPNCKERNTKKCRQKQPSAAVPAVAAIPPHVAAPVKVESPSDVLPTPHRTCTGEDQCGTAMPSSFHIA